MAWVSVAGWVMWGVLWGCGVGEVGLGMGVGMVKWGGGVCGVVWWGEVRECLVDGWVGVGACRGGVGGVG